MVCPLFLDVRVFGNRTIVTNGDQTDTIFEAYEKGRGFCKSATPLSRSCSVMMLLL